MMNKKSTGFHRCFSVIRILNADQRADNPDRYRVTLPGFYSRERQADVFFRHVLMKAVSVSTEVIHSLPSRRDIPEHKCHPLQCHRAMYFQMES